MPVQLTRTKEGEAGRPAWSPDGTRIAILVDDEDKYYAYDLAKLALVPAGGGVPTILTPELDRAVSNPSWTADGEALVPGMTYQLRILAIAEALPLPAPFTVLSQTEDLLGVFTYAPPPPP